MLLWILNDGEAASSAGPGVARQPQYIIQGIGVMVRVIPWLMIIPLFAGN